MRRSFRTASLLSLIFPSLVLGSVLPFGPAGFFTPTAFAAIPQVVNYQSRLRSSSLAPITALTSIQFTLYTDISAGSPAGVPSSGGPVVWKEVHDGLSCAQVQPDADGYFSVQLGACTPFPAYITWNEPLYLGVKIGSDTEASPRVLLGAHQYALNSQAVNGFSASTTAQANSLLALDASQNFNIATGTFMGAGLDISSTSTLQHVTFTVATGTSLNLAQYLSIGAIRLDQTGTSNLTSGAYLVGVFDEFDNSNATTVQAALRDFDLALTAVSSTVNPTSTLQRAYDGGGIGLGSTINLATSTPLSLVTTVPGLFSTQNALTIRRSDAPSRGLVFGNTNFGANFSNFGMSDDISNITGASGVFAYYNHNNNVFGFSLLGNGGSAKSVLSIQNTDNGQSAAFELENQATTNPTGILRLRNIPDSANIEVHVGMGSPENAVTADAGSIFMQRDGYASGTQLYVKTQDGSNQGWVGLATVDMVSGSLVEADTLQTVTDRGNQTTTTIQFAGGTSTADLFISGRLGVNNTTPSAQLEVSTADASFPNGWGSNLLISAPNFPSVWLNATSSNNNVILGSQSGAFYVDATSGTASNGYMMQILGNGLATFNPSNSLTGAGLVINAGASNPGAALLVATQNGTPWIQSLVRNDIANSTWNTWIDNSRRFQWNSPTAGYVMSIDHDNGNVRIGNAFSGTASSKLHVDSQSPTTAAILTLQSLGGDIQQFVTTGTPEGSVTGSIGDLATDVMSGRLYFKQSGTSTNTGWISVATGTTLTASTAFIQNGNSFGSLAVLGTNDVQELGLETNNVERLRITTNGRVGIGTSTPLSALHVSSFTASGIPVLTLENGAGDVQDFIDGGNPNGFTIGSRGDLNRDTSGALWLKVAGDGTSSGWSQVLTASSTLSELDTLQAVVARGATSTNGVHVQATSTFRDILPEAHDAYTLGSATTRWASLYAGTVNVGTSTWSLAQNANGNFGLFDQAAAMGNQRLMVSATSGNVGIGSTAPESKLFVNVGNVDGVMVRTTNSGYIGVGTSASTEWRFANNYAATNRFSLMYNLGSIMEFNTSGNASIGTSPNAGNRLAVNGSMAVGGTGFSDTAAPANGLIVGGSMGVGTSTPATKLHVLSNLPQTTAILTMENQAGNFQIFNVSTTPEGFVTASIGDLAVDSIGGRLYIKQSGTSTNTGWVSMATGTVSGGAEADTFQSVTARGNQTTTTIQFAGGTSTGAFAVQATSTMRDMIPAGPYTGNMGAFNLGTSTTRWNAVWAGVVNIGTSTWSLSQDASQNFSIYNGANQTGNKVFSVEAATENIGIGTAAQGMAPQGRLHVLGGDVLMGGNSGEEIFKVDVAANLVNLGDYQGWNGSTYLQVDDNNRRVIIPNGNVGIGTTKPHVQFDVAGIVGQRALDTVDQSAGTRLVVAQGAYAYVVNREANEMSILDISHPGQMEQVGTVNISKRPTDLVVQGQYAYVTAYDTQVLYTIDISDAVHPTQVGSMGLVGGSPSGLDIQGKYAYVVEQGGDRMEVVDLSDPSAMNSIATVGICRRPQKVMANGRYAYAICEDSSMAVIDIQDPTSPIVVNTVATGRNPMGMDINGRYMYVTAYDDRRLNIFDLVRPAEPRLITETDVCRGPMGISVQATRVYVSCNTENIMQIVDVSDPTRPENIGTNETGKAPAYLTVQGRYAFVPVTDGQRVESFDLGGAYLQQLQTGGIQADALSVLRNATVGGLAVERGLSVGGSARIDGSLTVSGGIPGRSAAFTIDQNGQVGIGTMSPDQLLSVNGEASKVGGGTWSTFSDERLKKDISPYEDGLDLINKIKPVHFSYNGLGGIATGSKAYVGVLAQDIQHVAPYMVATTSLYLHKNDPSPTEVLTFDPNAITYALINSVKELDAKLSQNPGGNIAVTTTAQVTHMVGIVAFGQDALGLAKIQAGAKQVRVHFSQNYPAQPIVTLTPMDFVDAMYRVTEVDVSGFSIQLNQAQSGDRLFSWHAFAGEEVQVFVSDGTTSTVDIIQPPQAEIFAETGQTASSSSPQLDGSTETPPEAATTTNP